MLFVKRLLMSIGLAEKPLSEYSIACISTTRPIYLVFGSSSEYPEYVIRRLNNDLEFQTQQIHGYLYRLLGNLVPKPIGLFEYAGDSYDLQKGVKGLPWFQIASRFRTEDERSNLEQKLWQTLKKFQSGLNAEGGKDLPLRAHEELAQVYMQYTETEKEPYPELEKLVEVAVSELSHMPTLTPTCQHGDFCLNNVIIDTSQITVIDFENFGITKMPLYDHFTLALSLPSCSNEPDRAFNVCKSEQIVDYATELGVPRDAISWHFLHHVLLRLGPWSTGEQRSTYRAWLKQLLDSFVQRQFHSASLESERKEIGASKKAP